MIFGCLIGGYVMDKYGRKFTQMISCPIFVLGWLLVGVAQNLPSILIGRFITGFCSGFTAPSSMIYIGETSEPRYRGFLLSIMMSGLSVGMFVAHGLGTLFSWRTTSFISAVLPAVAFCEIYFVPESPSWLGGKNRAEEAEKAFIWCRGSSRSAMDEMKVMLDNQAQTASKKITFKDFLLNLKKREFFTPFFIVNMYFVITQLSGVNAVPFYSISIIKDTVGDGVNTYACMLLLDVFRVIVALIASILTKQIGRRPLTMLSGIGTTVSLLILAFSLHFIKTKSFYVAYFKLGMLILYICFITLGLLPLPWILMGELFPPLMRGFGGGLSSSFSFIAYFTVVKSSPLMFKNLGADETFALFGIAALLGTTYLYYYLPETKDKTLQEIEDKFKLKPKTNKV